MNPIFRLELKAFRSSVNEFRGNPHLAVHCRNSARRVIHPIVHQRRCVQATLTSIFAKVLKIERKQNFVPAVGQTNDGNQTKFKHPCRTDSQRTNSFFCHSKSIILIKSHRIRFCLLFGQI